MVVEFALNESPNEDRLASFAAFVAKSLTSRSFTSLCASATVEPVATMRLPEMAKFTVITEDCNFDCNFNFVSILVLVLVLS